MLCLVSVVFLFCFFFFLLSSISLYGCTTLKKIHFPVDGYLDSFQFLAFMNNVAMNIHVPVFV